MYNEKNLLKWVVQDHDMGLTEKYAMATSVKEKPNPSQDFNSQDISQAWVH